MRILLAGLLGGIAFFGWNSVSWMVLSWHEKTMGSLPSDSVRTALLAEKVPSGLYTFPAPPRDANGKYIMEGQGAEAFTAAHREGGIGLLIYTAEGSDPMPPEVLQKYFVACFVAGMLLAVILSFTTLGYLGRVGLAVLIGLLVSTSSEVPAWIFWNFPDDYTLVAIADQVIGYLLAGILSAGIVPARTASPEQSQAK